MEYNVEGDSEGQPRLSGKGPLNPTGLPAVGVEEDEVASLKGNELPDKLNLSSPGHHEDKHSGGFGHFTKHGPGFLS